MLKLVTALLSLQSSKILTLIFSVLKISVKIFELCKESRAVTSFSISKSLGILKLGSERDLSFVKTSHGIFSLFNLPLKILLFNLKTLLLRVSLIQSAGHFIKLLVGVNNGTLKKLSIFVQLRLLPDSIFKSATGFLQVTLHTSLVLFCLDFVRVQVVNLLSQFSHGIVMLLAKGSQCSLMGNV